MCLSGFSQFNKPTKVGYIVDSLFFAPRITVPEPRQQDHVIFYLMTKVLNLGFGTSTQSLFSYSELRAFSIFSRRNFMS